MSGSFFGTDGVRGRANSFPIDPHTVLRLGLVLGLLFRRAEGSGRVVIGKDTRLSGYMVESALISGLMAMGMDALLLGPLPTPGVSVLVRSLRADLGVMISASHNGFEDNGLKFFGPDGCKLSRQVEERIEQTLQEDLSAHLASSVRLGRAKRVEGARARYVEYVKSALNRAPSLDGIKVVVDCANGAAYRAAPEVLWELGASVEVIHDSPDGLNINDGCGSTQPGKLGDAVLRAGADVGIALDGDADRLVVVDEKGETISGDHLLGTLAYCLQKDGLLTSQAVVGTILANGGLEMYLRSLGLGLIRTDVGDRNVVECMLEGRHSLGGEPSGHIVLGDCAATGDALLVAVRILAYAKRFQQPVGGMCRRFDLIPHRSFDVSFERGSPPGDVCLARIAQEGARLLDGRGRFVARRSGTQQALVRVMIETQDGALAEVIREKTLGMFEGGLVSPNG